MSTQTILEYAAFFILPIFSSVTQSEPSRTDKKIEALSKLPAGWHYGSGESISAHVIDAVKRLHAVANHFGITETDVFPGSDGDVMLVVYRGDDDFSLRVCKDGRVELDSESRVMDEMVSASAINAERWLAHLAKSKSWNSFSFSTPRGTTFEGSDLTAYHSKILAMEAAYLSLNVNAPFVRREVFASTLADTTKGSHPSRLFSGSSMPLSFQPIAF